MSRVTASASAPLKFSEVKPATTSPAFRRYIEAGLKLLAASDSPEAKRTLKAINGGRVKIDLFSDLTAADFRHMKKDLPDEKLVRQNREAYRAISRNLNGYMWDDRVYVHRELSPKKLAATLVHEVTHVLTKAEENYRGPKAALRQEYAAFYAEKRFLGFEMTPARCLALKRYIIDLYALKGVTPADVPDLPVAPAAAPKPPSRASAASR